ncbi:bifunctional nicotinamidase/pyrazinamidase [Spirochaeta dissipatitropha]
MKALLIIDVQNDFCPGGSLPVPQGDAVVPVINRLSPHFDLVAATKDWHPKNHVSFSSNHPGAEVFDTISVHGLQQMLWPVHCVQNTEGAELHPDLNLAPVDLILHKGTKSRLDSYSAFFENDGTTPTGLESFLKGHDVQDVYLCGLAEDVCVFRSAEDAADCGFQVTIISDATAAVDTPAGIAEQTRAKLKARGVRYIHSRELLKQIGTAAT